MSLGRLSRGVVAALVVALSACGGGGGGTAAEAPTSPVLQPPPEAPAQLSASGSESIAAVTSALAGAEAVFAQDVLLPAPFSPFGESASARERPQALTTLSCQQVGMTACSGSLTIDTDVPEGATVIAAGSHLTYGFQALRGTTAGGTSIALDGAQRIDFVTALDTAGELAGVRLRVTSVALAATIDGIDIRAGDSVAEVAFDADGNPELTINGFTFSRLGELQRSGDADYRIDAGRVRSAHWSDADAFVDHDYEGWSVTGNRPGEGSKVTIGADDDRIEITVTASSTTSVRYAVQATIDGHPTAWVVEAAYATGGQVTYTATPG